MSSRLIIAGAGSGKTTWLINEALKNKEDRVLITTFTDANEANIRGQLFSKCGCIPSNITVLTWFSLLLQHGVKPYQSKIYSGNISGLLLVNQKSGFKTVWKGRPFYYGEKDTELYYLSKAKRIFSDKIAKFTCRANEESNGSVINRLCRIFPNIFIDEVQDLAGYDLEILKLLHQESINLVMVGDPRQVTYHTHDEAKYKQYNEGKIADYVKAYCKGAIVDETTLSISYRNNKAISEYANKVYPSFPPCTGTDHSQTGHDGIFLVSPTLVEDYILKYHPVQLRDKRTVHTSDSADSCNFGNSKGLTFDRVLIYPTKPMIAWMKDHSSTLEPKSRAKLYVAITRAKHSVAFVDEKTDDSTLDGITRWYG